MIAKRTNVLHGKGKPRIVIPGNDNYATGEITDVNGNVIKFSSITKIDIGLINRQIISKNKYGSETRGKIIDYNTDAKTVTIDNWNNEESISPNSAQIKNEVIDLPWTEELFEWFDIIHYPPKEYFYNGEEKLKIRGFRYRCVLDYGKYMLQTTLAAMQNVYNANRVNNFIFIPHRDNEAVYYKAELTPETALELAQLKYYQGHKYVKFQFSGVELLDGPDLRTTKHGTAMSDADGTIVSDADGTGIS